MSTRRLVPSSGLASLFAMLVCVSGCAGTTGQAAHALVPGSGGTPSAAAPADPQIILAAAAPQDAPGPVPKPDEEAKFAAFIESFRDEAIQAGIRPETYDRAVMGLTLDRRVLNLNDTQPEFVRPVWEYLAGAVSDARVRQGSEKLLQNVALFDRLEAEYGVPRHLLVALWGLETNYGQIMGRFNLFQAFATFAYEGPRQAFGRREFIAALKIAEAENIDPQRMEGSWAGAFGHMQFTPTTFLDLAVDADGDGKRDLWNSSADAIASAAAYVRRSGWRGGETWGEEVRLPENFPFELADDMQRKPEREWAELGVLTVSGGPLRQDEGLASIYLPAGARGPAFILRGNFNVILRYNNAATYALAIGLLADRLAGRGVIVATWPREEQPLSRAQRLALQEGLNALGFEVGTPDAVVGRQTRAALRAYQKARGLPADGFATTAVLARIEGERAPQTPPNP